MLSISNILKSLALNTLINNINKQLKLANSDSEIKKLKKRKAEIKKQFSKRVKKHLNKKVHSGLTLRDIITRDMLDSKDLKKNNLKNKKK